MPFHSHKLFFTQMVNVCFANDKSMQVWKRNIGHDSLGKSTVTSSQVWEFFFFVFFFVKV